jgi:hypothetical protein
MIQNSLCGGKFSFVRGSKNNRYILWCSHSRLQERNQSKVHIFKEDKYGQEGVKEVSVKRKSSRVISSIDAMAGKQESKLRKISMSSTVSQYSNNQPSHRRVHSIRKSDKNDCCKCRVAFFLWPDGYYYLDHKTTNIDHNGHPQFTPHSKLKGITYLNDESKFLIERMSAVNDMSINMMHVRHWKVYDAHYGDTTKLGRLMIQAQEEHFMNEGMGVCITDGQNKNLAKTPNEMKFERKSVHLCQNTSIQDVAQAKFVITRSEQSGCTLSDFINYLNQKKDHHLCSAEKDHTKSIEFETNTYNDSDVEEDTFTTYRQTKKFLSPVARRLQSEIDFSQQSMDLLCDHSIEEIRKNIITTLDNVISSPRMPSEYVKIFQARALEKLKEMDSELSALKTELYKDLKSKHCGRSFIRHHMNLHVMRASQLDKKKGKRMDWIIRY